MKAEYPYRVLMMSLTASDKNRAERGFWCHVILTAKLV